MALTKRWMTGLAGVALAALLTGCEPAETATPAEPSESASDPAETEASAAESEDAPNAEPAQPAGPETLAVTVAGRTFDLELALDPANRFQGLSDRAFIAPDGGMLFVFTRARNLEFVMRRCLVPIDIIFLDSKGYITATHAMQVEPYGRSERDLKRYGSRYPAQFAIELAGGTLAQLDLDVSQPIDLPMADLKARAR